MDGYIQGMKQKPTKAADLHKSGFMVRLPEEFRACLKELKAKNRRDFTVEVQIALEAHFKANGIKFPPA